jgi:hypothetical protein
MRTNELNANSANSNNANTWIKLFTKSYLTKLPACFLKPTKNLAVTETKNNTLITLKNY